MSHRCIECLPRWYRKLAVQTGGREVFNKECPLPINGSPVVAAEVAGSWIIPTCQPLRLRFLILTVSACRLETCYQETPRCRSFSRAWLYRPLVQIECGVRDSEHLALFWSTSETRVMMMRPVCTQFQVWVELAVWPNLYLTFLATRAGEFYFHFWEMSLVCHSCLKQSPIQVPRTTENHKMFS